MLPRLRVAGSNSAHHMAQPFPIRRAAIYRQRAQELTDTAREERRADVKRHMLDQAATFQRAADAMAPPPPEPTRHLSDPFKGLFDPPRVRTNGPQVQAAGSRDLRQRGA